MKIKQLLNESLSQKDIDEMIRLFRNNSITKYSFNDDSVDLSEPLQFNTFGLSQIPVQIGDYEGDFIINSAPNLKTLINIPNSVDAFRLTETNLEVMDYIPSSAKTLIVADNPKLKVYMIPDEISRDIRMYGNAFETFSETFTCGGNVSMYANQLNSFEDCPTRIYGFFDLSNNKFTSLKGIHKHLEYVGRELNLSTNSIKDGFLDILRMEHVGEFIFGENTKIEDIINENLGKGRSGILQAQTAMIEAGFEDML